MSAEACLRTVYLNSFAAIRPAMPKTRPCTCRLLYAADTA